MPELMEVWLRYVDVSMGTFLKLMRCVSASEQKTAPSHSRSIGEVETGPERSAGGGYLRLR